MLQVAAFTLVALTAGLLVASPAQGEAPKAAAVAEYAPAKETEAQFEKYLQMLQKSLQDEQSYGDKEQSSVALDASTVAVLALTLGMHETENRYRQGAAKLVELAGELAENADDFQAAKAKLAELTRVSATAEKAPPTTWEPAADLALLMKQVPIVNNSLRRGVTSRRFARSAEDTAGHAITLAAIAQASLVDTSYCGDEDDEKEWQRICGEMRDAAAQVFRAVQAKDQNAAKSSMEKIVTTCDECHEKFRD